MSFHEPVNLHMNQERLLCFFYNHITGYNVAVTFKLLDFWLGCFALQYGTSKLYAEQLQLR